MQTIYKASRYVLPVLFLGYGVYGNIELFRTGQTQVDTSADLLSGKVTIQIDHLYKSDLPHREGAVGLVGAVRYALMGEGRKGVLTGEDGWLFTAEEARVMEDTLTAEVARIVVIRDQLAAAGVTLVMVPVPAKSDIHAETADFPGVSAEMAARYDAFQIELAKAGIVSVETRAPLLNAKSEGPAFFATDTHWTIAGADAVAKAVADTLTAKGLSAEPAVFTVQPETAQDFTGDLVSFVTSDELAPVVGLAPETVTPFVAIAETTEISAGDLFGGAISGGIALVGTSYSANPRWSFAEALKVAIGADVVNFAAEGQGPARPMLAWLKSADFRNAPPSVILWEFPVRYLADPSIWDESLKGDKDAT
jgi:alginate O-acetyltransferase complex protein AlgJ